MYFRGWTMVGHCSLLNANTDWEQPSNIHVFPFELGVITSPFFVSQGNQADAVT